MKHLNNLQLRRGSVGLLISVLLGGCSDDVRDFRVDNGNDELKLELRATIEQNNSTRADESGFTDGDRIGVFVVNYSDKKPGQLTLSDNQVNNVAIGYSAVDNSWQSATDIYWLDEVTPADVYGYYPYYSGLNDVDAYRFEVSADQSIAGAEGDMGNYEASDLLWAKKAGATPGKRVDLKFNHVMAGVKVTLQKGTGFEGDAWEKLPKIVTVDNTVRTAEVNLATGVVTASGSVDRNVTMNPEGNDTWRAVVVPQSVAAGNSVIGITIDGVSYNLNRQDGMTYASGKLHTFTISIDRKEGSGDYALTLVNEDILPWEADNSSHNFDANSYLNVNVAKAGTLKESLEALNCDLNTLKNLKITGELTDEDFRVMREEMPALASLHIGNAKTVNCAYRVPTEGMDEWDWPIEYYDNMLPENALGGKESLRRVVLPEGLTRISNGSFHHLRLTSTLIIPESVKRIDNNAFECVGDEATIIMPSSLEYIGAGAFYGLGAQMELKLGNTIKYIGGNAFYEARNVTGTFNLPNRIEYLGEYAFYSCGHDMTGDIVIPSTLKEIPQNCFRIGFANGTTLTIPEGVTKIGGAAFTGVKFNNHVVIPSSVKFIDQGAFMYCSFKGGVTLPESVAYVSPNAFAVSSLGGELKFPAIQNITNNAFTGTQIESLVLGDNILQISRDAFSGCGSLRFVTIGKNVEYIGENAFADTWALSTVVCLAPVPPVIKGSAFSGFDTDRVILEVPENAVEAYRAATGWNVFQNITPHHELAFNLPDIVCLDKGITRNGMVRAEGRWSVVECPSWVHVTPDNSDYNDEVTVTVDPMESGAESREGKIVFKLSDKDYTTYTTVRQLSYEHAQDTEIVLQTASADGTEIPIFIVGEGFGAERIVNGEYMRRMEETMEQFFSIEPYKTYRAHFTVTTAIACSPDDNTGDLYTYKENCFNTDQVTPQTNLLKEYVKKVSTHAGANINNALIIMVSNHNSFTGWSDIDWEGCSMASVGIVEDVYPYDQRGLVQHFAGGAAFAGLASETVSHFEHIKGCTCPGCADFSRYNDMKSRGYFANITMSSKMTDAPWNEFIFHPKYSLMVDMWEGGYRHLRGVWRSEANSVMSSYISYFNTISRYTIYKEIMRRAGRQGSLDDFIANDIIEIPQ